ncbi:MAG: sigma-70 family RNA polymerase sigma factor [Crocinitomicaceae bacterium]|nr:sigma-70 family RNA polymerase sigma factor [Crocinitomicaceae bacterium]
MLYEKYSAQMYSICMRYAKNKDDADDIFQQGFYLVYKNIGQIRDAKAMSGWIKRIFVNAALENYNKKKKISLVEDEQLDTSANLNSWNEAMSNLAAEEITNLIQKLPNACRTAFNMYVIDNMTHKEIAKKLSISEGTSKSNLHDARKILKRKIINSNKINLSLS